MLIWIEWSFSYHSVNSDTERAISDLTGLPREKKGGMWNFLLLFAFGFIVKSLATHQPTVRPTSVPASGNLPTSQFNALHDLYNSTNGLSWIWMSSAEKHWNFTEVDPNPCAENWQGVVCASCNCTVTELKLAQYNLTGTLPASIDAWVDLNTLDLNGNHLTGTIPTEIGNLGSLEYLNLYENLLRGSIPSEIGKLLSLENLYLYKNSINGTIPSEIGSLKSLKKLDLHKNLLSGTVPSEIGNLILLKDLSLYENQLNGTIPSAIGDLTALQNLYLYTNLLGGTIPSEIGSLLSLQGLYLYGNGLSGSIPSEIGKLLSLEYLYLYKNVLNGTIPSEIGSLRLLVELDLHKNVLSGTIPSEFGNLLFLENLSLNENQLNGTIPNTIGDLAVLQYLYLYTNLLSGTIPSEIGNLLSLQYLYLYGNSFSGSIPSEIGKLLSLEYLYLYDNSINGTIPEDIGSLKSLIELDLHSNLLTGTISTAIGNLGLLQLLSFHGNSLRGSIPSEIGTMLSLEYLYLYKNTLNGTIPSVIGNLRFLIELELYKNVLSGTIPSVIGNLLSLEYLYLYENQLNGTIPSEIGSLRSMIELDLHSNLISGTIPTGISDLDLLQSLNFHGNSLRGTIPSEIGTMLSLQYLYLYKNQLNGTIPSEIGSLSFLIELDVYGNVLSGTIPGEIGNLIFLEDLFLDENQLNGTIPSTIGNLLSLQYLYLYTNRLSGTIPDEIGNLILLQELYLYGNSLSGSIPSEIGKLLSLEYLYLNQNRLNGTVPSEIGNLLSLQELYLYENRLNGTIPSEIGNLLALRYLYLYKNHLIGIIPSTVGNLLLLQELYLDENRLSGTIPSEICACLSLTVIELGVNFLTGSIPACVGNITFLETFSIAGNYLFGSLPSGLSELKFLHFLSLEYNLLSGSVPQSWGGNFSTLETLFLRFNQLTGSAHFLSSLYSASTILLEFNFFEGNITLPDLIGIDFFLVSHNSFSGTLPFPIASNEILQYSAGNNYFTGRIPSNDYAEYLLVPNNYLTGTIGNFLFDGDVSVFNVSANLLTGILPESYSFQLQEFYVNSNFLTGTIPSTIGQAFFLLDLYLQYNQFSGTVPAILANLTILEDVFLQNNNLFGSVEHVISVLPSSLIHLDISNNQFTGQLSSNISKFKNNLETFAAVSNCLSGSIPEQLCELRFLQQLNLDGLATGSNCQSELFTDQFSSSFNAYTMTHFMRGGVPACLFALTNLTALHLSGNALIGSLPADLSLSEALSDLSLSHNLLTGTIPIIIQAKPWVKLDLSYNSFTGTISNSVKPIASGGYLYLEVNRLSGTIPNQLLNTSDISVLNGNIFSCSSGADLPSDDPDFQTFSCGSNTADDILYTWAAIVLVIVVIVASIRFLVQSSSSAITVQSFAQRISSFIKMVYLWRMAFISFCNQYSDGNVGQLRKLFEQLRQFCFILGALVIILFFPTYSALTFAFKTFSFEYAWTVSGILLSGVIPALVMIFVLCFLLIFSAFLLQNLHLLDRASVEKGETEPSLNPNQKTRWNSNATYFTIVVADVFILGSADILYVITALEKDSSTVIFAGICLALFRMLINNYLIIKGLPWISQRIAILTEGQNINDSREAYQFTNSDLKFLIRLVLLNQIILPILAVLVVLPDCFRNAFFAASMVSSSYSYEECIYNSLVVQGKLCRPETQTTSYAPPFLYSYQCASKVLINYVPVYLLKFMFAEIIFPLTRITAKFVYDLYMSKNKGARGIIFTIIVWVLPMNLQVLPSSKEEFEKKYEKSFLFSKLKICTKVTSYLAILLVFGGIFPPLAIIGLISLITMTWYEEMVLGRILLESGQLGYDWYVTQLAKDSEDMSSSLRVSIGPIVVIASMFFAYLIFDTWSDSAGWYSALPGTVLMASCPPVMLLFLRRVSAGKIVERARTKSRGISLVVMNHPGAFITTENPIHEEGTGITTKNPILEEGTGITTENPIHEEGTGITTENLIREESTESA
jgi:Leucine-rich repeat (LRR) protein